MTAFYRPRWRFVIVRAVMGFFFGLVVINFGIMARPSSLFSVAVICLGLIPMGAAVLEFYRAGRSFVGCTGEGVTFRGLGKAQHIPYDAIRTCKLVNAVDPVKLILTSGRKVSLKALTDCSASQRNAFMEAVNAELARRASSISR